MKTLIISGSPRDNGNTQRLVFMLTQSLNGEHKIVNAYKSGISPCIDCRYCSEQSGCSINDQMQEVYEYIRECDNILIASPVYFSGLTPPIISIGSRLQTLYCGRTFRKDMYTPKPKKGAVILTRDGDGEPDMAIRAAKIFLRQMYCENIHEAEVFCGTDENVADRVRNIAAFLNA